MAWSAVGLGAGLVLGALTGKLLGRVTRQRLRPRRDADRAPSPPLGPVAAARAAQRLLATQPELAHLEVRGVGRGIIEVAGWVGQRTERTRAARLLADQPGIESVINSILVHGEDDQGTGPNLHLAGHPA